MKIFNIFKKEHHDEYVFTEEDYVFQHCHKRYYLRDINGVKELWCRSMLDQNLNFYIGKVVNGKVILSKAFYTHPWDVQKGGGRLARIYLYNDWTEL